MPKTLYHGTLIHSLSLTQLEVLPDALLCVSDGIIEWLERGVEGSRIQEVAMGKGVILGDGDGEGGVEVVVLGKGEVLCPGMIDTHTVSGVPRVTTNPPKVQGPRTSPSPPQLQPVIHLQAATMQAQATAFLPHTTRPPLPSSLPPFLSSSLPLDRVDAREPR
jgi:hypothetical protein